MPTSWSSPIKSIKMFDVAWAEPVETVGQRKSRKDKQSNRLSQASSVLTSKSSDSSSSPSQSQARPSLFGLFNHKKGALQRSGSSSKLSTIRNESTSKASKRISTYTTASDSSNQELSDTKTIETRIPLHRCSDDGHQSHTDTEISSPSDGSPHKISLLYPLTHFRIHFLRMDSKIISSD